MEQLNFFKLLLLQIDDIDECDNKIYKMYYDGKYVYSVKHTAVAKRTYNYLINYHDDVKFIFEKISDWRTIK